MNNLIPMQVGMIITYKSDSRVRFLIKEVHKPNFDIKHRSADNDGYALAAPLTNSPRCNEWEQHHSGHRMLFGSTFNSRVWNIQYPSELGNILYE